MRCFLPCTGVSPLVFVSFSPFFLSTSFSSCVWWVFLLTQLHCRFVLREEKRHQVTQPCLCDRLHALRSFLTAPDLQNEVFLSPLGEAFFKGFQQESAEAELADWPAAAEEQQIDAKISTSLLRPKHHKIAGILVAYRKIAELPWVETIISGNFENTRFSRIKQSSADGIIRMLWADSTRAANLMISTTAQNRVINSCLLL